jgi:hypothetical protein
MHAEIMPEDGKVVLFGKYLVLFGMLGGEEQSADVSYCEYDFYAQ